jgi:hypothetical protein
VKKPDRQKMTFRIDAHLARQLSERARSRRVSQTEVLEAALASMLTPDQEERVEAVLTKRLDRLSRQLERLEWHVELSNEAFAIFVRFWLTSNAPLPDEAMRAAQATGKKRYQAFVESLAKRMEAGPKLRDEVEG